jgi:hypothetical protein
MIARMRGSDRSSEIVGSRIGHPADAKPLELAVRRAIIWRSLIPRLHRRVSGVAVLSTLPRIRWWADKLVTLDASAFEVKPRCFVGVKSMHDE